MNKKAKFTLILSIMMIIALVSLSYQVSNYSELSELSKLNVSKLKFSQSRIKSQINSNTDLADNVKIIYWQNLVFE